LKSRIARRGWTPPAIGAGIDGDAGVVGAMMLVTTGSCTPSSSMSFGVDLCLRRRPVDSGTVADLLATVSMAMPTAKHILRRPGVLHFFPAAIQAMRPAAFCRCANLDRIWRLD
jgi:hypothetical protein